ncbi:MAG: EamA family transporter [Thermoplasmata archaeon]|nr:EamA family transporter [Thermoplasmata archaeon]
MRGKIAIFAIVATLLWGASFTLTKQALSFSSPLQLAFVRYLIASFLFIIFLNPFKGEWKDTKKIVLLALFGVTIPVALQNVALEYVSAYVSGFLQSTGPIYTLIMAYVFLNEEMNARKIAGIMIAFAGTYMIVKPSGDIWSNVLVIVSAIFYSSAGIIAKSLISSGHDGMLLISRATVIGSIFLFPLAMLERRSFSISAIEYASLLAVLPTFVAYILWYKAMEETEISKLSAYVYLIPLFSTLFAFLLLGEEIKMENIIYGMLILAGVAMAEA